MAGLMEQQGVRIAITGCGHGVLNSIYASIEHAAHLEGWDNVDLVIIGGDFQVSSTSARAQHSTRKLRHQ
jgi:lariat debranching enzyme